MKVFRALLLPLFALTASMVVLPGSASAGEGHERLAKVCEHIQCSDQQERAIGQVFEVTTKRLGFNHEDEWKRVETFQRPARQVPQLSLF